MDIAVRCCNETRYLSYLLILLIHHLQIHTIRERETHTQIYRMIDQFHDITTVSMNIKNIFRDYNECKTIVV
jgi:hypothetical protein